MNQSIIHADNKKYIKPVALININRQDLTLVNNKILNFFIYLSTSHYEINKQLFIPNCVQSTSLKEIAVGIEDNSRRKNDLKQSVLNLAKATAKYGVFNIEGDDNSKIKQKGEGVMTYIDYLQIHDDDSVEYKLGEKFFQYISDMLMGNERYFRPSLEIKNKLTSISSTVLYELASSYTNNTSIPLIKIDNGFMDLLGMSKKYINNLYDFKKRVMSPALAQLRSKEILSLGYEILEKKDGRYIRIFKEKNTSKYEPYTLFEFIAKNKNASSIKAYAKTLEKSYEKNSDNISDMPIWKKEYQEYLLIHKKITATANKTDILKKYTKENKGTADFRILHYFKDGLVFYKLSTYIKELKHKKLDDFIIDLLLMGKSEFELTICTSDDKEFYNKESNENWQKIINNSLFSDSLGFVKVSTSTSIFPLLIINHKLNIDALRFLEYEFSLDINNSKLGFIFKNIFFGIDMINSKTKTLILKQGISK